MNAIANTARNAIELDPHPLVIGHAIEVDTQTIAFDHRHYHRTGKTGHSMHDSTPVAEYRSEDGHTVWVDPLNRVHAHTLDEARGYRAEAVRQGAREVPVQKVHRIEHTRLKAGDALYDAHGRKVDEVLYFTYGLKHSERIVHTRAGYAHATRGGYLLGLSNRAPE
ncbi:hypothetical protein [Caballeronia sp. J97]|uniref:hypothetical protein n=1 Tax=Caballeronia sp. J97 TaxID=2805429 RepID=UPI002AB25DB5|nr:hypothetical protein [Caballeronia sp. J97]